MMMAAAMAAIGAGAPWKLKAGRHGGKGIRTRRQPILTVYCISIPSQMFQFSVLHAFSPFTFFTVKIITKFRFF